MGWEIGYDTNWSRDIGYGVPAYCDEPGCDELIDRGLAYVCCNQEPYGGEDGCGLYFCGKHLNSSCTHESYQAKQDAPRWIWHKLTDSSWREWRDQNPDWVAAQRG